MKRNKFLLILACILMLTMTLTGCGGGEPNKSGGEHHEGEGHAHGEYEWIGEFELKLGNIYSTLMPVKMKLWMLVL